MWFDHVHRKGEEEIKPKIYHWAKVRSEDEGYTTHKMDWPSYDGYNEDGNKAMKRKMLFLEEMKENNTRVNKTLIYRTWIKIGESRWPPAEKKQYLKSSLKRGYNSFMECKAASPILHSFCTTC